MNHGSARRTGLLWALIAAGSLAAAPAAHAQLDSDDFFRQNCQSCHTIGGTQALTGPDLRNVQQRAPDREWLIRFLMNPRGVIDGGDPYARKLFEASRNYYMPTLPGMTRQRAIGLLEMIEEESQLEESQFKGLQISTEPFTAADREAGRRLFTGRVRLAGGGPSCLSCHSMHDVPGGGRLGPDLTNVYGRVEGGRAALSAWLSAPASETMLPIFKDRPLKPEEIHQLVAYFEASAGQTDSDPAAARVGLLLLGLTGAAALVFLMDAIWKRRFHSVRQPLVESSVESSPVAR